MKRKNCFIYGLFNEAVGVLSYPPNIRDIIYPAVVMKIFLNIAQSDK